MSKTGINLMEAWYPESKKSGKMKATCCVHATALKFKYTYSDMSFRDSLCKKLDIDQLKNGSAHITKK